MNRTLITVLGATLAALVAILGLFFLMARLSAPATAPALATPTTAPDTVTPTHPPEVTVPQAGDGDEVPDSMTPSLPPEATPTEQVSDEAAVATVDGTPITRVSWQTATRLDTVMSRLAGQPIPSPEETLDRLINEILLLRGADLEDASATPAEVEARIASLKANWNLSDAEIVSALEEAGLTRQSFTDRVARLILIERAIKILSTRHPDLDAWLAQARQAAEVSLNQAFAVAPRQGQNTPPPVLQSSPVETPLVETDEPQGEVAPDFTLDSAQGVPVALSDYRGQSSVVLVFYRGQT